MLVTLILPLHCMVIILCDVGTTTISVNKFR